MFLIRIIILDLDLYLWVTVKLPVYIIKMFNE
jgi:hypothetical protein